MNLRTVERVLAESLGMFSIGAVGGSMAKAADEPWQKFAVLLSSAALEMIFISPNLLSYITNPSLDRRMWRQLMAFGHTFVLPSLLMGAGIYVGSQMDLRQIGRLRLL